jgi:hypothetical protein
MNQNLKIVLNNEEVTIEDFIKQIKAGRIPLGDETGFSDKTYASLVRQGVGKDRSLFSGRFDVECIGQDGNLKWEDSFSNIVTNVGLQHILDILFVSATTQVDPWLVALVADNSAGSTIVAGDTMASHAGWTEDQNYSEGVRQTYVDVRSGQSVTNTASKASFSINGTTTISGAFLTSDNTKGGTSGTLLAGGNFTGGDRAVLSGDTLNITYTFTAADDGV